MSYRIIQCTDHEQWLELRKKGVGASEIATLFGESKQTPLQLWQLKRGESKPTFTPQQEVAMQMGHALEALVADMFAAATQSVISMESEPDFLAIAEHNEQLRVSPDRLFISNDNESCVLECKTTAQTIDSENIPIRWYLQLQYQMHVLELDKGAIAWLETGVSHRFGYKWFKRNEELGKEIEKRINAFWQKVESGEAPDPVTDVEVGGIYPESEAIKVEADDTDLFHIAELKRIESELKALEATAEAHRVAIKQRLQEADTLTFDGQTLCTWKTQKGAERFDSKRFKAAYPNEYKMYVTQSAPIRRFLIK